MSYSYDTYVTQSRFPLSVQFGYVDGNLPNRYVYNFNDYDSGALIGTIELDPAIVMAKSTWKKSANKYIANFFTINLLDIPNVSVISNSSVQSIPDGAYTIILYLYYPDNTVIEQDIAKHGNYKYKIIIGSQQPSYSEILNLFSPISDAGYNKSSIPLNVVFGGVVYSPLSMSLTMINLSTDEQYVFELDLAYILATSPYIFGAWSNGYNQSIGDEINFRDIYSNDIIKTSPVNSIPDGRYHFLMTVQFTHRTAQATRTIIIDGVTEPPLIISPSDTSKTYQSSRIAIMFQCPENSNPNSFVIDMINQNTNQTTSIYPYFGTVSPNTNQLLIFDTNHIVGDSGISGTSFVRSATHDTIPEGIYTMRLTYQDAYNNMPASSEVRDVIIDFQTEPPQLLSWVDNGIYSNPTRLHYHLPEPCDPGSVHILFVNAFTGSTVKILLMVDDQTVDYIWDRTLKASNPPVTLERILSQGLGDGLYDIKLGYTDVARNNAVYDIAHAVRFKSLTKAPTINSVNLDHENLKINFALPDIAQNGQYTINVYDKFRRIYTTIGQTDLTEPSKTTISTYDGDREILSYDDNTNRTILIPVSSIPFSQVGTHRVEVSYRDYLGNATASKYQNLIIPNTIPVPSVDLNLSNDVISCTVKLIDYSFAYTNNYIITFKNLTEGIGSTFSHPTYPLVSTFSVDVNNPSASLNYVSGYEKQLLEGQYEVIITLTLSQVGVTQSFSYPFEFSYSALGPIIMTIPTTYTSQLTIPFTVQSIPTDNQTTIIITNRDSGDNTQDIISTPNIDYYHYNCELDNGTYHVQVVYNTTLGVCQDSRVIIVDQGLVDAVDI